VFDPVQPFVLVDDAASGRALLFSEVREVVTAHAPQEVRPALVRLGQGGDWAGWMGFEAGHALEPRLARLGKLPPAGEPLLWFARFGAVAEVDAAALLAGFGPVALGAVQPEIGEAEHAAALARVQALIAAGDIYQANLTFPARLAFSGHPLALHARLRAANAAPQGALVFDGARWLLSLSPELFFRLEAGVLTARPMKGTARRGATAAEDAGRAAALASDAKNRAENLMIVDLLRNDLSRVGDGVEVPALFEVETYPSILQMTSTVTARLKPRLGAADVLAALFPCGSVTGAPKIRAMEVIGEVEPGPRGVYTGSIGWVRGGGEAWFNVAIRTLVVEKGAQMARLGLGSGVVADSGAADEWQECLAKAGFLARRPAPDLIETMRVVDGACPDLDWHLTRMAASAAFLGHRFDGGAARERVLRAADGVARGRLRLLAGASGALAVQVSAMPAALPEPVQVRLVPLPVAADDWRLAHKTSDRGFYDAARRAAGTAEVVFVTAEGQVSEGSFTNVFVERDGRLLTPPLGGLLPGVLRARLIDEGRAVEAVLTAADLGQGFFLGNALRGLMPAVLVA
jgi:para-aminobenzoate synthetase/4-amino-4-deoxychorismate lyase